MCISKIIFFNIFAGILLTTTIVTAKTTIDAGVYANNASYFFQGDKYYKLKGSTVMAGYPKPLNVWKNMPASFLGGIDAAMYNPKNKRTYFFRGNQYVRLNGITVEQGYPKYMTEWKKLPQNFLIGIDAAIYRKGYTYFFKGNQYVKLKANIVIDGYPRNLPGGWDLPNYSVSAAFHHYARGKNYFFYDDSYYRLSDVKKDQGYPKNIDQWKGLEEAPLSIDISPSIEYLGGIKFRGQPLSIKNTNSSKECNQLCFNNDKCTAFSFDTRSKQRICYLYHNETQSTVCSYCDSAVKDSLPSNIHQLSLNNSSTIIGKPYKSQIQSNSNPYQCQKLCSDDNKCQFYNLEVSKNNTNPKCQLFSNGRFFGGKDIAGSKVPQSNSSLTKKLSRFPGYQETGNCSGSIVLDIFDKICDFIPRMGCFNKSNRCKKQQTLLPIGAKTSWAMYSNNNGVKFHKEELSLPDGKALSEALMCSLRELSPKFPLATNKGSVVSEKVLADIAGFGKISYKQTLGYLDFNSESRLFKGYRNMSFCAPIIGCFDSVAQELSIQQKTIPIKPTIFLNNSDKKGSGLISKEKAINEYYAVEIKTHEKQQGVTLKMVPGFTVTTPAGPITVSPKFQYDSTAAIIHPYYLNKNEKNKDLINAYGIDDAIAAPYSEKGINGWQSQIALGNRDPSKKKAIWDSSKTSSRPDFDLMTARKKAEKKPSTQVIASAELRYPDPSLLNSFLPRALRNFAKIKFQILIEPQARAAFSSQFNIINSTHALDSPMTTEFRSKSSNYQSDLKMITNASHAFGLTLLTGMDLTVTVSLPFGKVEIIDVHPRWPFEILEKTSGTASRNAHFIAKPNITNYKSFKNTIAQSKIESYLKQCLANNVNTPKEQAPKPKAKAGEVEKLFKKTYTACNVCVFYDKGKSGTIFPINRPSTAQTWNCDMKTKTGCYDVCSLDVKTGEMKFFSSPNKKLLTTGTITTLDSSNSSKTSKPINLTGEICYSEIIR